MRTRPRLAPRIVTRELRTYRIQVFEWVTVIDIACVVSFDELLRLAFKCAYAWRLCLRCACGLALRYLHADLATVGRGPGEMPRIRATTLAREFPHFGQVWAALAHEHRASCELHAHHRNAQAVRDTNNVNRPLLQVACGGARRLRATRWRASQHVCGRLCWQSQTLSVTALVSCGRA